MIISHKIYCKLTSLNAMKEPIKASVTRYMRRRRHGKQTVIAGAMRKQCNSVSHWINFLVAKTSLRNNFTWKIETSAYVLQWNLEK